MSIRLNRCFYHPQHTLYICCIINEVAEGATVVVAVVAFVAHNPIMRSLLVVCGVFFNFYF